MMKKLYLLICCNFICITVHADPTLYGKIFLSADVIDTKYENHYLDNSSSSKPPSDESTLNLNSNYSRIGIKGSENLSSDTDLIYQLEYGIDVDTDSNNGKGQFYARNTYIGVSNKKFGTILAGHHDTPFKLVKSEVDMFGNHGATLSIDHAGPAGYNNLGGYRMNNIIAYKSPSNSSIPVTLMTAVILSEQDLSKNKGIEKNPSSNGYSTSLVYDKDGMYLAAAYDKNVGVEEKSWRVLGSLDAGKFTNLKNLMVGAMYQNADIYENKDNAATWLVSAKYKVVNTPWLIKGQYINTNFNAKKSSEAAIGTEYKFNKNMTGHIYAGQIKHENFKKDTILGTGIEYSF